MYFVKKMTKKMKKLLFADLLQLLLEGLQCCPIQFSFELKTSSQNLLSNTPDSKPEDGDKNVCFLKSVCFAHNSAQSSVSFSFMKH